MRYILFPMLCLIAFGAKSAYAIDLAQTPPGISLPSQKGKITSLDAFRGKVVYLDFWASWCGPCKHSLPWMETLSKKYGNAGLEVVAINLDTKREDADELLKELRPSFTILFDSSGETAGRYDLPSLPTSFLINREGKIAAIHPGFEVEDEEKLESQIRSLLQ